MEKKEYKERAKLKSNDFVDETKEWHYIEPKTTQFERIITKIINLYPDKNDYKICDAGIGLGTMMYYFYIETKQFENNNFKFYGVEKYKEYVDFFDTKLKQYWDNNITIYIDDIMNHNYSDYDIVYLYAPFKKEGDLINLYQKIVDELKPNSILLEYVLYGNGFFNTVEKIHKNNQNKTSLINLHNHNVLVIK